MARKKAASLDEARKDIAKTFKRGARTNTKKVVSLSSLSEVELATKREAACFLKAAGYSHSYIAEALDTTKGAIKGWFAEEAMVQRVAKIRTDFLDGAVKYLRTYAIELIEMLVTIARTTDDEKIAMQAITEALDRMGLTKVNKSESAAVVTRKDELSVTDRTGLLERARNAPPEVQQQLAQQVEDLVALASEHAEPEEEA